MTEEKKQTNPWRNEFVHRIPSHRGFDTFEDCWPTTIGEAAVSYDTASDSMVFDVTWSYNYYTFV